MQTTTPRIIRADFVRQIVAISPSHAEYRSSRFRPVASVDLVQSAELRSFHLDIPDPAFPSPSGIYGSGVAYDFTLWCWLSYRHLAPEDDDSIITTDGAQIWSALQGRYDPALAGLIAVEPIGWEHADGGNIDGARWGAHLFQVTYLQDV